jgi:hypothetical protein
MWERPGGGASWSLIATSSGACLWVGDDLVEQLGDGDDYCVENGHGE